MVDVRLTIRSVLVQCLHRLLIQPDNHNVWPNVEFTAASHRMGLVRYPFATVHIGNSNTLHIGRATGHAVLEELQEDLVKAAGFIVSGSGKTRETGPSIGASPENPELATWRSWIVEHGCVLRNKLWTSLQSGCDLLGIRFRLGQQAFARW